MDNYQIISIVVALVVMIPGVIAVVKQAINDKRMERYEITALSERTSGNFGIMASGFSDLQDALSIASLRITELENSLTDDGDAVKVLGEKLLKKMYEIPIIKRCGYCGSANVTTSLNCTQCGAPAGNFVEIKNDRQ